QPHQHLVVDPVAGEFRPHVPAPTDRLVDVHRFFGHALSALVHPTTVAPGPTHPAGQPISSGMSPAARRHTDPNRPSIRTQVLVARTRTGSSAGTADRSALPSAPCTAPGTKPIAVSANSARSGTSTSCPPPLTSSTVWSSS